MQEARSAGHTTLATPARLLLTAYAFKPQEKAQVFFPRLQASAAQTWVVVSTTVYEQTMLPLWG